MSAQPAPISEACPRPLLRSVDADEQPAYVALLNTFLETIPVQSTRDQRRRWITTMHRATGAASPAELTEGAIVQWCVSPTARPGVRAGKAANGTVRQRAAAARVWLDWCARHRVDCVPSDFLRSVRDSYATVHGKQQSDFAARFLDKDQVGRLLAACQDGTLSGLRDELAIRLGLLSLRNAELRNLSWDALSVETTAVAGPRLHWTGKGNKPRSIGVGTKTLALMAEWKVAYEHGIGHAVTTEPVLCARRIAGPGRGNRTPAIGHMKWGTPMNPQGINSLLLRRSAAAGLGHIAPHDLRRTTASTLHRTVMADGGHRYSLAEIQEIMGHASPETTRKCYIGPLDSGSLFDQAGAELDF